MCARRCMYVCMQVYMYIHACNLQKGTALDIVDPTAFTAVMKAWYSVSLARSEVGATVMVSWPPPEAVGVKEPRFLAMLSTSAVTE